MSVKNNLVLAAAFSALTTACANNPLQTRYDLPVPNAPRGSSPDYIQQMCADFAQKSVPNPTLDTLKEIAIPALMGGGVGAGAGAIFNKPKEGAMIGATAGTLYGGVKRFNEGSAQDQAFKKCLNFNSSNAVQTAPQQPQQYYPQQEQQYNQPLQQQQQYYPQQQQPQQYRR